MKALGSPIDMRRLEFDGVFYRDTSRGNTREPTFITDTNRILFFDKKESASIALTPLAFQIDLNLQPLRK